MRIKILILTLFLCFTIHIGSSTSVENSIIYEIDINQEINTTSWIYLLKGLNEAKEKKSDVIILHLNTYGGTVVDADSIRSAILYNSIPVYVFIDNNAASAGALIAISCKGIYMRKGANMGAATVVNQVGEQMPDKYQSYMRSIIRATAEAHGKDTIISGNDTIFQWKRDPHIAEAMVDDRIYIPNIIDSGKILTFTAEEAMKFRYCDGIAESVDEVITKYLHFSKYELHTFKPTVYDNIKGFILNPIFQAFLIMIIVAGIYFELQSPGLGFPSIAALTAAILYFSPLYIDGLAQHWEIIIFLIGILLIIFEVFVIPGFGIAGISGIVLVSAGLTLALINNVDFSFENVTSSSVAQPVLTVLCGILLGFFVMIYLSSLIGTSGIFKNIALNKDLESSMSVDLQFNDFVGKTGTAMTVLRPSGKIFLENEMYDAISINGEFIEKDDKITVIRFENAQLYVIKS